ncbi:hypothetical protein DM01DRAFT_1338083 [Hesseltinella vesiculosa]|uniref:MIF4G domain-containing protein n=1 Tax=Hesseltinella vesiculosa TaxID=101127 RepID=A0A1X2GAM4_9FUNG|nr:hypothetical protein DM01DRAFT_1338083 [Hesseltinella vesiculosa]
MGYRGRGRRQYDNGGNRRGGHRDRHHPYGQGSGQNYHKRKQQRRYSPEREEDNTQDRLRGLIIKIGDKITADLQSNLLKMRNILETDYDNYSTMIEETLQACVSELSVKAPIYGALIGLLNSHNVDGGSNLAKLMDALSRHFSKLVIDEDWTRVKIMLRFYGEAVNNNVISPSDYCELLADFLTPLANANEYRPLCDTMVYLVLSSLPWCGKTLAERASAEFSSLLATIDSYMGKRQTTDLSTPSVFKEEYQDLLLHMWQSIQALRSKGWEDLKVLVRPHKWFIEENQGASQHKLPKVDGQGLESTTKFIQPLPILKIFTEEDGKTTRSLPDHDSLEYFLLHDMIADTSLLFESNRKESAKFLINIATGCPASIFTKPDDGDDYGMSLWVFAELLMETLMSQMLHLPKPCCPTVYFPALMIELVRLDKEEFPRALGRTVKTLFDRLPTMDVACIERLWTWFAMHLSNFGFQWDWAAWESALTKDPMHPQVCFMRETLEKEIRLSYFDRIKNSLPSDLATSLLPSQAPAPQFAYADKAHELHDAATKVVQALKNKVAVDDVQAILNSIKQDLATKGYTAGKQDAVAQELFIQCLLLVGCKSFSHVLNVIERYIDVLRLFNQSSDGKVRTMEVIAAFWKQNSQFLAILVDKFLNYRIVDPTSVVVWVFDSALMHNPSRAFIWDILKSTLDKVVSRVDQVEAKLDSFKDVHQENQTQRMGQPETEESRAMAQQELDTLHIVESSLNTVRQERQEVFLTMHRKFESSLQTLLASAPAENLEDDWTRWWINGRFKEMQRLYPS